MRRRRPPDTDSLELLLDTICNTFGGVLFVALLIVILVRLSGNVTSAVREQVGDSAGAIKAKIASQEVELRSLQSALREHQANLSNLEADDSLQRARQVISLQRKVEELSEQRMSRVGELASAVDAKDRLQRELAGLAAEVAQLKAEQIQLASQLLHERQVRSRTARLPVLHSTSKAELPAILRFGRLYFPYRSFDDLRSRSLNLDDFLIVSDSGSHTRVTPKPYAGTVVDASQGSIQEVTDSFSPLDKGSSYIAIAVWEDSFGQFAIVKDTLVRLGLEYRLVPVAYDGIVQEADIKESLVQ